jgi:hypothetical protein
MGVTEFFAQEPLLWSGYVSAIVTLAVQPWRRFQPTGSLADGCGVCAVVALVCALVTNEVPIRWVAWGVLVVSLSGWLVGASAVADNHHYLYVYWALALAVAMHVGGDQGARLLTRSAEAILATCFGLAVLAKARRRRYRDGSVFAHMVLVDSRFLCLARYAGGLDPDTRRRHLDARRRVTSFLSPSQTVIVPRRVRAVAIFLTWWAIVIEAALAVLYALPATEFGPALVTWRGGLLAAFVCSTYAVVAVPAFGQILLVIAMAADQASGLQVLYLALLISVSPLGWILSRLERTMLSRYSLLPRRGTVEDIAEIRKSEMTLVDGDQRRRAE